LELVDQKLFFLCKFPVNDERVEQEDGKGCKVRHRSRRHQIPGSNVLAENRAFLGGVNQGMAETECPFWELCSRHESKFILIWQKLKGVSRPQILCGCLSHDLKLGIAKKKKDIVAVPKTLFT
jgi:hypothetical protein